MNSFESEAQAVVIGAGGGIGSALAAELAADPGFATVHALSRQPGASTGRLRGGFIDVLDEVSIAAAAARIASPLHLVIIATGALQGQHFPNPEKSYKALEGDALVASFQLNTIGPALVAKHFLPIMAREGKTVFAALSARVGSITDNRAGGWHAYRAAKAALNMLMRNFAIETARRNAASICVTLHPGTVDTGLSRPFHRGLPTGQVITPQTSAAALLRVIDSMTPADSGQCLGWDGKTIPP